MEKTKVQKNMPEATRRPYHKPWLEEVRLLPEEAVLQGCKLQHGGIFGPMNRNCKGAFGPGGDCLRQMT